jgi:hypothetical protein
LAPPSSIPFNAIDGEGHGLVMSDYMILAPEIDAEILLEELAGAAEEALRFAVCDPRFHRCDLLALLLSRAQTTQLADPLKAAKLACLTARLADAATGPLPVAAPPAVFQAHLVAANSFRLARSYVSAEDHLFRATPGRGVHLADDLDRAHFCRTLALVRWERGLLDEALALLQRAAHLFGACRRVTDSATCSLLAILLLEEMGSSSIELLAFTSDLVGSPVVGCCLPWLVSRAFLTLASSLPRNYGDVAFARGIQFFGLVTDPAEQYRILRLEGRARARLGFPQDGEEILEAVRRAHLRSHAFVDLTLTSIDLLALRTSQEKDPRIAEIEAAALAFSSKLDALFTSAIDRFVSLVAGDEEPWSAAQAAISWFLARARFLATGPDPLPFV